MPLGHPGRPTDPLHVVWMALSLAAASMFGAGIGLVWQSAGFGDEEKVETAEEK